MNEIPMHWQEQAEERSQALARSIEHQRLWNERKRLIRLRKPNSRCPTCAARIRELTQLMFKLETNRTV